jgi:3-phosphoglycerate kinase
MNLPKLENSEIKGKSVLVRVDLDFKDDRKVTKRQEVLLPTLDYLSEKAKKIVLLAHRGRPGGRVDSSLSLKTNSQKLRQFLIKKWGKERVKNLDMEVMENLRFNKGEEENDEHFTEHLAEKGEFFVNESFANSHRKHASIVGLPKVLPHAAGFHFAKEIDNLTKVIKNPQRPLVTIIAGRKEDKLSYLKDLLRLSDMVLIAGRLPEYLGKYENKKAVVAKLVSSKKDIEKDSIDKFKKEISKAKTIVVSGPIGKFEDKKYQMGTKAIFTEISKSSAFKVAGGGETERVIAQLDLTDSFDWISIGGGAMLEFLAKGTLPGIEALLN